jgi:hypothetical protein
LSQKPVESVSQKNDEENAGLTGLMARMQAKKDKSPNAIICPMCGKIGKHCTCGYMASLGK